MSIFIRSCSPSGMGRGGCGWWGWRYQKIQICENPGIIWKESSAIDAFCH